ncbi:MAG TPA: flavodoxin [Lachnospiraceae bacterium]|nr:flavodoxin [Lachnospiraceae bacterium]
MKDIVVYYSLEGNTKRAAERIAKELGADLMELKPVKDLSKEGGFRYVKGGFQAMFGFCPKLKETKFDVNVYDRVILGTPVWAGKPAPAMNSFLKKNDIGKKAAAVFTCSGSGDSASTAAHMKKCLPALCEELALIDQNSSKAGENEEKLEAFISRLRQVKDDN